MRLVIPWDDCKMVTYMYEMPHTQVEPKYAIGLDTLTLEWQKCGFEPDWKQGLLVCLLHLATSKVISWRVLTCDRAHAWRLYSAAPLQTGPSTPWPISHPVTLPPCWVTRTPAPWVSHIILTLSPILEVPSVRLGNNKYQFCKSLLWHGKNSNLRPSTWQPCDCTDLATAGDPLGRESFCLFQRHY